MHHKVFLIHSNPRHAELLKQSLRASGHEVAGEAMTDSDFRTMLKTCNANLLIIDCDTPSRLMLSRLRELSGYTPLPTVLFTAEDNQAIIQSAVRAGISAYIVDGFEPGRLASILDVAVARFRETERLRQELAETRASLNERKNIERAKGILMKQRGCDESAAYHALRKVAMDKNLRIGQVAENVIAVAELLS